jgi:divalent metal cation (Fe/Co/Zn/Cd) transporter
MWSMQQRIQATAQALSGIFDCHNVRMRYSGARLFVDAHVLMDGNQTLR